MGVDQVTLIPTLDLKDHLMMRTSGRSHLLPSFSHRLHMAMELPHMLKKGIDYLQILGNPTINNFSLRSLFAPLGIPSLAHVSA